MRLQCSLSLSWVSFALDSVQSLRALTNVPSIENVLPVFGGKVCTVFITSNYVLLTGQKGVWVQRLLLD